MKELIKAFKEQPKEAIKEVAMCVFLFFHFAVRCCLSAILGVYTF